MASQESLKNGADVSITEFIKYIINTGNAQPMTSLFTTHKLLSTFMVLDYDCYKNPGV